MINAVYLLRGGRHWDPEVAESSKEARRLYKIVYLIIMVLGLFLSEWSYAKLKVHTVDSRSESIQKILEDISPVDANALSKEGWRYPKEILQDWDEAKSATMPRFRDRIRQRLELVSLVNMGSSNARLLESAGIHSVENLQKQKPDELFPRLVRMNEALRLRKTPLVKRRVLGWIGAARRQSALF
jgi:hypothetical protein